MKSLQLFQHMRIRVDGFDTCHDLASDWLCAAIPHVWEQWSDFEFELEFNSFDVCNQFPLKPKSTFNVKSIDIEFFAMA